MTRAVPHVVGNFHTLVYIRVPVDEHIASCARRGVAVLRKLNGRAAEEGCREEAPGSPVESDDTTEDENDAGGDDRRTRRAYLHLSLCKPMYLKRQFIRPFRDRLEEALGSAKQFYLILDRGIAVCANEERTRFFAVLPVEAQCNKRSVLPLIDIVDEVAEIFGYPKYYEQRLPHVSLAVTGKLTRVMQSLYGNGSDYCGELHSSHHWLRVEHFLHKAEEAARAASHGAGGSEGNAGMVGEDPCSQNVDKRPSRDRGDSAVHYSFLEEALLPYAAGDYTDSSEPICIHVKEVHIVVGSHEHSIRLA